MKTIIAGCRDFMDPALIPAAVSASGFSITEVVSGAGRGVDQMGEAWAKKQGLPFSRFPADWDRFGNAAGPIRNQAMAKYAQALIAVWDGKSRGTGGMIELAHAAGLPVYIHWTKR